MPVHPLAQALLDDFSKLAPLETLSVEQGRQNAYELARMLPPGEPVGDVADRLIPGSTGSIPIRAYWPKSAGNPANRRADALLPIVVYFHGGGWVLGDLDTVDGFCRVLTNASGCIVISVNYRHAPEHKFPAAAEDAYAATSWISQNARSLGGDGHRLAVCGSSAGGNLAAVTSLMARDRGGPPIAMQVLAVPVTNHAFETASYRANGVGYGLTTASMRWFWNHYLASDADGAHRYASPLRAPDLKGLPPAFVLTAEFDPLRDEGEAYAEKLRSAGVPVLYKCYAGMIHMLLGQESNEDMARELRSALGVTPG
jgi:acetyl esterase